MMPLIMLVLAVGSLAICIEIDYRSKKQMEEYLKKEQEFRKQMEKFNNPLDNSRIRD